MLEIGFEIKIPKIYFVSCWKISLENLSKKLYDQTSHKKVGKNWENLNFLLNWQSSFFRVFPLYSGMICHKVQRADLTCDVIKKLAPFVLNKLWILVADWSMRWSCETFLIKLRLYDFILKFYKVIFNGKQNLV